MINIYDVHRYLYHYTDFTGLKGILETQTLWATHYKALNDFSEVQHMRSVLERATFKIVNRVMREKAKQSFAYKRFLNAHGGLAATSQREAKKIVGIFYQTTFKGRGDLGPFAEPYVVSFCAHTHDDDYVKQNGLLSQWRAYGNDGGFALVFDTKRLWRCLEAELETYGYSAFYLADVVYDDAEAKFETEFGMLTRTLEKFIQAQAEGVRDAPAGDVFQPFFNSVTRFKHRGFKEENEVRITASPIPLYIYETGEAQGIGKPEQRVKPTLVRQKRGVETPYIVLNDLPTKKTLPIAKIIVGPQRNQKHRAKEVRKLLGRKQIEIVCSETPFIPA